MQSQARQDDDLYYTDASAGDILRQAREHYGQTLPDIENALHIRASQIQALEQDNYEQLPGRVYAIGFVRSYSEYLGLDPDQMVNLYKSQMSGSAAKPELHFPAIAADNQLPSKFIIAISLAFIVIALISWSILGRSAPAPLDNIPSIETVETVEAVTPPETEIMGPPAPDPATITPPAPIEKTVTFTLTEDSWVEIRDIQGQKLVSRVLKKGEVYNLKNREDLLISIGNAGGLSLTLSNEKIGPMGIKGEVIRNFPISYASLKEKYSPDSVDAVNTTTEN